MNLASGASLIGTVQVRYTTSDPLSAELRAASLVRTTNFDVPGLPPAAILCVRRVSDPLPGQIHLERWRHAAPHQWNRAVTDTLATSWRAAVRPALEPVHDHAEAVWFADRAELLAALAMDWTKAAVGRRWWWRNLVSPLDTAGVFGTWETAPEFVPAAIEFLATRGAAIDFVRRLPAEFSSRLLKRVLASHGVVWSSPGDTEPLTRQSSSSPLDARSLTSVPAPPWRDLPAGSSTSFLSPAQEALLAVSLMIRREPARVRSADFIRACREWFSELATSPAPAGRESPNDGGLAGPRQPDIPIDEIPREPVTAPAAMPPDRETPQARLAPTAPAAAPKSDPLPGHVLSTPASPPAEAATEADPLAVAGESPTSISSPVNSPWQPSESNEPARQSLEPAIAVGESQPGNSPVGKSLPHASFPELQATPSEFGGLLFVLNAAVALGLYSDFTAPLGYNLDTNPWDLLALMGEQSCGREFRADPIWAVLARLACRPIEKPPAGLPPSDKTIDALAEWIAGALQMEPGDASGFLIKIPAKIATTLTHVDAFFSLQQHPIEIRLGGLDRDPGWIPAAGRYVAFHFD